MSFIVFPVLQGLLRMLPFLLSDPFADMFPFLWQKNLLSMPEHGQ